MPEPRDGFGRLFDVIDEPPRPAFANDLRARLLEALDDAPPATAESHHPNDEATDHEEDPTMSELSVPLQLRARPWRTIGAVVAAAAIAAGVLFVVGRGDGDVARVETPPATTPTPTVDQPEVSDPDGAGPITAAIGVHIDTVAATGPVVVATSIGRVLRVDGRTNEVLAERTLVTGGPVVGDGAVWVLDQTPTLHRLDAETLQDVKTLPVPGATGRRGGSAGSPLGFEAGRVWMMTADTLIGVDAASMQIVVRTPIAGVPDEIAAGLGSVWVRTGTPETGETVVRVDATSGAVLATVPLPGHAPRLGVGGGSVWVADLDHGDVLRIDPATNTIRSTIHVADHGAFAVAASDTQVWVGIYPEDALVRIDPATEQVVERIDEVYGPTEISIVDGTVWVASSDVSLTRIDTAR